MGSLNLRSASVAKVSSLRGIEPVETFKVCRLEIGDTAGWKPALQPLDVRIPAGLLRSFVVSVFTLLLASLCANAELSFEAVQSRVAELQPRAEEKRFDEIGWAKDIRDAQRLAKEHNRPGFLFTHDGRMNIGRC
jgi:hypothetical protein